MNTLPVIHLYTRLLAQWRRAKAKDDRAAMLILSSRLNALAASA